MASHFFNPLEDILLSPNICFLTGGELSSSEETINVFPDWIMDNYNLRGKKFKMMDQVTQIRYEDLKLPCSEEAKGAFLKLEKIIKAAFEKGYEGVIKLPEEKLFLWMGKIVYGILYHDMIIEKQRLEAREKDFNLSGLLKERYSLFHLMLQSLVKPVSFSTFKPWSFSIVKLKYSKDIFHYRDNPVNLVFSLGTNGFGIIACLQDNGAIKNEYKGMLDKINDTVLHPVQFEELCARMLYSNYLMQYRPKYKFNLRDDGLEICAIPFEVTDHKPLFAKWDDKVYAQVLAGYLEAWGYTTQNIVKFPDGPISFLIQDYSEELVNPESISLPF